MAGTQGFEPRYADPESAVLPLDDVPVKLYFNTPAKPRARAAPHSTLAACANTTDGHRLRIVCPSYDVAWPRVMVSAWPSRSPSRRRPPGRWIGKLSNRKGIPATSHMSWTPTPALVSMLIAPKW